MRVFISAKLSPIEINCPEDVRTVLVNVPAKIEPQIKKESVKAWRSFNNSKPSYYKNWIIKIGNPTITFFQCVLY